MTRLAYSFAEAVQLTVDRENIPVGELGMLANFASRSIQMQRDELPDAALNLGARTVVTYDPKIVPL